MFGQEECQNLQTLFWYQLDIKQGTEPAHKMLL